MAYVSCAEIVHNAWISPTAVELKIPAAIAKARRMQSEGRSLVTRERTAASTLVPPFLSRYVKFAESIPMVPDPVLRGYFNESLTFSEYRDVHLYLSVSSPPNVATFWILAEDDDPCCPWSIF